MPKGDSIERSDNLEHEVYRGGEWGSNHVKGSIGGEATKGKGGRWGQKWQV